MFLKIKSDGQKLSRKIEKLPSFFSFQVVLSKLSSTSFFFSLLPKLRWKKMVLSISLFFFLHSFSFFCSFFLYLLDGNDISL